MHMGVRRVSSVSFAVSFGYNHRLWSTLPHWRLSTNNDSDLLAAGSPRSAVMPPQLCYVVRDQTTCCRGGQWQTTAPVWPNTLGGHAARASQGTASQSWQVEMTLQHSGSESWCSLTPRRLAPDGAYSDRTHAPLVSLPSAPARLWGGCRHRGGPPSGSCAARSSRTRCTSPW